MRLQCNVQNAGVPTGTERGNMAEQGTLAGVPVKQEKKRVAKPGTRRLTITVSEAEFDALKNLADNQMREPNNMLSLALKGRLVEILQGQYENE